MDPNNLPGPLKVAILIKSMGEIAAQKVLSTLTESERELIRKHMKELGEISPQLVEMVAKDFTDIVSRKNAKRISERGGKNQVEKRGHKGSNGGSKRESVMKTLDANSLVKLVKDEYPQTIAMILTNLDPSVASKVLSKLPDELKPDVAIRIAKIDKIASDMVDEIDQTFAEMITRKDSSQIEEADGVSCLADILNQIDSDSSDLILNEMDEQHPDLAYQTRQGMFVFEDLVLVDDKGLQKLLRSIETRELAVALKGATGEIKEKVFKNMSERAGEMVIDEIETIGSVRMKDVEMAQMMITKIIQDLHQKNEIIIAGRGGEELIA
ncbi:MAG: flagellar motor switch protein FliG [Deltaproteobacteria bacterium]|nr:flagellar motor switch protein FliG [Deltaproteobacteria bacterium]